jgi:hypothetical protein
MLKYFQLIWLVITHGHLRHRGRDFNIVRAARLSDYREFIPEGIKLNKAMDQERRKRNPIFKNLVAQTAFIKSCFRQHIEHIQVPSIRLAYIRMPKSASTSVGSIMLKSLYPSIPEDKLEADQINFLIDLNLTKSSREELTYFTIVRNPYARLVSVYRDFFERSTEFV